MKLKLQRLSSWQSNEKFNIALSAPMSPMMAAQDFVKKVFPENQFILTGLFRIIGDGEPAFTTWEHADTEPVQIDVIVGVLNFQHLFVFGEIGSQYMPISIVLEGEAQFSELYTQYKWIAAPTPQEIAETLEKINLAALKSEFETFRWKVKGEMADDWFLERNMQEQSAITGESIPRDALAKWDRMTPQEKYESFKKWQGEVIILQAGDPWLSSSSLRILGIFSDEDNFKKYAGQLLEKNIITEWGYKSLTGYYGNGRQCDYRDGALTVSIEPLNPSIEDTDI